MTSLVGKVVVSWFNSKFIVRVGSTYQLSEFSNLNVLIGEIRHVLDLKIDQSFNGLKRLISESTSFQLSFVLISIKLTM